MNYITVNDPGALIIIGADHGGFAGLSCTADSKNKITDKDLIYSMFGAQMAIRWGSSESKEYDAEFKTGINLFRTVFSFLGKEKKYLKNREKDDSFIRLNSPPGLYNISMIGIMWSLKNYNHVQRKKI